jgi:O-antigen ligase
MTTDAIGGGKLSLSTLERILLAAGSFYLLVMPFRASIALRYMALSVMLAATFALWHRRSAPPIPRLVLYSLAAWLALCVSSVLWSVNPLYSARELKHEAVVPPLLFVIYFLSAQGQFVRFWNATLLAGLVMLGALALGSVALTGGWDPERWHAGVGPYSTWLVMTFPLVLGIALPGAVMIFDCGRWRWPLFALISALVIGSAYLTLNRIIWPSLAVSLAVFGGVALVRLRLSGSDRRRLLLMSGVALLALMIVFGLSAASKALDSYPTTPTVQGSIAHDARIKIWRFAAQVIPEAPLLGHGFGRAILGEQMQAALKDEVLWHGHNVFLNAVLQLGVVGLAALVALFGAIAWRYVVYVRSPLREANVVGIVGLAFLAGFLVKNSTDDFLVRHTAALFWAMNGMLMGYGERLLRPAVPERVTPAAGAPRSPLPARSPPAEDTPVSSA